MADHIGTPGSNADNSINGSINKSGAAPKDKACPFCHQQFTSSSLGRHLDLYIKEKHPKPPDGIHLVDEIRKLRGGITRRQPRQSLRRRDRDTSTPNDHDQGNDQESPRPQSAAGGRSPSVSREDIGTSNLMYAGRPRLLLQGPTWEATGVMNNIPPNRNVDAGSVDGVEKESRYSNTKPRQVSRQVLAKSTFEQKQKLTEACDRARAAELALRELLGSLIAANRKKLTSQDIFDYDPLTFDFPSLCLHCLPAPPTLHATVPIHHPNSWNISPPGDNQYEALRAHFSTAFRNHRNTLAIASTAPTDDLSYPPPAHGYGFSNEDPATQALQAEAQAAELEQKINNHIHDVFAGWTGLSSSRRAEIWTMELARSVGRKSTEIQSLKKDKDYEAQIIAHLRQQNDDISRLQHPREFRLVPPQTIPVNQEIINHFGENKERLLNELVGFDLDDRSDKLDVAVEKAVTRWKNVVQEARGATQNGMQNQRSLSVGSMLQSPTNSGLAARNLRSASMASPAHQQRPIPNMSQPLHPPNGLENFSSEDMGEEVDADADADADMEEEESYADMGGDVNELTTNAGNEQQLGNGTRANGFRMSNGSTRQGMECL